MSIKKYLEEKYITESSPFKVDSALDEYDSEAVKKIVEWIKPKYPKAVFIKDLDYIVIPNLLQGVTMLMGSSTNTIYLYLYNRLLLNKSNKMDNTLTPYKFFGGESCVKVLAELRSLDTFLKNHEG